MSNSRGGADRYKGKRTMVSFRLRDDLYAELRTHAQTQNKSLQEVLENAIRRELGKPLRDIIKV